MLFGHLSLKEKGDTRSRVWVTPSLAGNTAYYIPHSIYYSVCSTCLSIPRLHIYIALCVWFMTFAQWWVIRSFWNLLFLQQNFSVILHSVLFILSSELLKFIVSTLALCLFVSQFIWEQLRLSCRYFKHVFLKSKPLSLHYLRKSVTEIWTVCCFDRKCILVLFSAWGGIGFQLKWSCIIPLYFVSGRLFYNLTE